MQRILFIILIDTILFSSISAQTIDEIKSFSDDQFENGNYQVALKEYQRVQLFDSDNQYSDIYSKIATIYIKQNDNENAIRYLNWAWNVEQNDSSRIEITLKKALCNFKMNDYYTALNELFDIPDNTTEYLKNKKNLYLGICYFGLDDYLNSLAYFNQLVDSIGVQQLNQTISDFIKSNKKFNPDKIEIMSLIFPGLGQFYIGEIGMGINSIALLSAVAYYSYITVVNYAMLDGVLILSSWFYRYYKGGSLKAKNAADTRFVERKSSVYSELISIVEEYSSLKKMTL
jgi:tetratricopeptide (TPR) repeat protein